MARQPHILNLGFDYKGSHMEEEASAVEMDWICWQQRVGSGMNDQDPHLNYMPSGKKVILCSDFSKCSQPLYWLPQVTNPVLITVVDKEQLNFLPRYDVLLISKCALFFVCCNGILDWQLKTKIRSLSD